MNDSWLEVVGELDGTAYQRGLITPTSPINRIHFQQGLTDKEIQNVEREHGFQFPDDLRAFLQTKLPAGSGFPDWRADSPDELREWMDRPRQGIAFDVEHNDFWLPEWGPRPESLNEAMQKANDLIRKAPVLIPIYGHRMMPAEPSSAGNPVFSVHQTDIIYYGYDLLDYLCKEFELSRIKEKHKDELIDVREIRFWDIERFQDCRWGNGPNLFDNSDGILP